MGSGVVLNGSALHALEQRKFAAKRKILGK